MVLKTSTLRPFALSLKEYLSLALETLIEESRAHAAYWFVHPEKTEYWDTLNLSISSKPFHSIGHTTSLSLVEFSSLEKHLLNIHEVCLLEEVTLKLWKIYSVSTLLIIPIESCEERLATIVMSDISTEQNLDTLKKKMSLFIRQMQLTLRSLHSEALAFIDDLTGLHNARAFHILMEENLKRSQKLGTCFSLLMIDIDDLKKINDQYGHLCGNTVIRETAQLMRKSLRINDHVCRYGGDEFAIILENSNSSMAQDIVQRLRCTIEDKSFHLRASRSSNIAVSIGHSTFPNHARTIEGLIQIADEAMYFNKTQKRNINLPYSVKT
ncbi:MAG: GGDEF domain-containing protein [Deltaproteobacteria bacterium]|nr:GGDEF domain-containing protein [Deltaproteobacteria bacterium]